MVKIKQYANTIKNGNKGGFKIMKIEHVAMYVNNLEQAKDFFVGYLDGVSQSNDRFPFLLYLLWGWSKAGDHE